MGRPRRPRSEGRLESLRGTGNHQGVDVIWGQKEGITVGHACTEYSKRPSFPQIKTEIDPIALVRLLHQHGAKADILAVYLAFIDDLEDRENQARR